VTVRVLVTGAFGFIGLNVVEALLVRGDDVIAVDLSGPSEAVIRAFSGYSTRLSPVAGDVRDEAFVQAIFAAHRPDTVVHGAALTPGGGAERSRMAMAVDVNILGTVRVLEASAVHACARLLFLSSGAVYGAAGYSESLLDEAETHPAPGALYPITKLAAERLVLRFGEISGLDVVAARLGAAFGPWEADTGLRDTLSPHYQLSRLAQRGGEAVLPRRSALDWNYSRDAALALLALLDGPADARVINVGPGSAFDLERFCVLLATSYPKFRWRYGTEAEANINLHGARDRAPLATDRLRAAGFVSRFPEGDAYADYIAWLKVEEIGALI
jgi:nucleoside-diphosphate-sugar epimerase